MFVSVLGSRRKQDVDVQRSGADNKLSHFQQVMTTEYVGMEFL